MQHIFLEFPHLISEILISWFLLSFQVQSKTQPTINNAISITGT